MRRASRRADDPNDLERWRAFHEAVEHLLAEERELVGLRFYPRLEAEGHRQVVPGR
jgi:hypothetical protein